ncbi:hypothetical protein T4E_1296 [Trichinella pseudospiralis]|uniref:Uncharacterized protein n=1 Tax=Trichinella pseudospiralis TaxID=6337 RepID=A0A0V0XUN5_TRIPS|nr:hypothetical protein T4E_1296 [Trichinella pseudospiralis]
MIIWKEPSINNRVYHLKQTSFVDRQKAFQQKRLELHGRIQTLLTNIYKGASRITADLETAGRFPTHKNVLNMCLQCAENREKISRAASNAPGAGKSWCVQKSGCNFCCTILYIISFNFLLR